VSGRRRTFSLEGYPARRGKLLKHRAHGTAFAALRLLQPAADATDRLKEFLVAEQLLICFGALDYDLRLAIHREYQRLSGPLQLADVLSRVSLERAQGVDVLQVQHGIQFTWYCMS
jgi:hypothetical protein